MIDATKGSVWWNDPQASATDVIDNTTIKNAHKPILVETLGWILLDDEDGISICNERYKSGAEWQYRGHTFIIRSLIVKVSKRRGNGGRRTEEATGR